MIDASTSCLTTAGALPLASPYATLWTKRPGSDHPRRSMVSSTRTRTRRMRHCALHLPVLHACDVTHLAAAHLLSRKWRSLPSFALKGDEEKARNCHDQAL